ncbi:gastrin/cholecystokinin type B receptor isoform X2 [Opisthocomus hoazin]|uniref:gastrin/cholecystokinin type B receptor isoform X2 n=1 Tax=Opisthocomus hoazin TaxID=30419 RepID=UPI003F539E94
MWMRGLRGGPGAPGEAGTAGPEWGRGGGGGGARVPPPRRSRRGSGPPGAPGALRGAAVRAPPPGTPPEPPAPAAGVPRAPRPAPRPPRPLYPRGPRPRIPPVCPHPASPRNPPASRSTAPRPWPAPRPRPAPHRAPPPLTLPAAPERSGASSRYRCRGARGGARVRRRHGPPAPQRVAAGAALPPRERLRPRPRYRYRLRPRRQRLRLRPPPQGPPRAARAQSDLMLALCCMPFTLVPNLMGTFVFGEAVCKLMAYLMGVSVSVSTFSLVAIAIESTTRAAPARAARTPATQCTHDWPSEHVRQAWYVLLLLILFFIPGVVMIVAYGLISRELYRGIRFELGVKGEAAAQRGARGEPAPACDEGDGCYLQLSRPGCALELRALGAAGAQQERARINSSEAKLVAKRRVIRMLVVIVAMFFLCWLPVFAANTWRAFAPRAAQRALSGTPISFIHLLSYTSACANPLIYCFMNRRFRKAFLATCARCRRARPRRAPDDEAAAANASLSKFSYTTVSSLGPP